jgi:hypothetical protein
VKGVADGIKGKQLKGKAGLLCLLALVGFALLIIGLGWVCILLYWLAESGSLWFTSWN